MGKIGTVLAGGALLLSVGSEARTIRELAESRRLAHAEPHWKGTHYGFGNGSRTVYDAVQPTKLLHFIDFTGNATGNCTEEASAMPADSKMPATPHKQHTPPAASGTGTGTDATATTDGNATTTTAAVAADGGNATTTTSGVTVGANTTNGSRILLESESFGAIGELRLLAANGSNTTETTSTTGAAADSGCTETGNGTNVTCTTTTTAAGSNVVDNTDDGGAGGGGAGAGTGTKYPTFSDMGRPKVTAAEITAATTAAARMALVYENKLMGDVGTGSGECKPDGSNLASCTRTDLKAQIIGDTPQTCHAFKATDDQKILTEGYSINTEPGKNEYIQLSQTGAFGGNGTTFVYYMKHSCIQPYGTEKVNVNTGLIVGGANDGKDYKYVSATVTHAEQYRGFDNYGKEATNAQLAATATAATKCKDCVGKSIPTNGRAMMHFANAVAGESRVDDLVSIKFAPKSGEATINAYAKSMWNVSGLYEPHSLMGSNYTYFNQGYKEIVNTTASTHYTFDKGQPTEFMGTCDEFHVYTYVFSSDPATGKATGKVFVNGIEFASVPMGDGMGIDPASETAGDTSSAGTGSGYVGPSKVCAAGATTATYHLPKSYKDVADAADAPAIYQTSAGYLNALDSSKYTTKEPVLKDTDLVGTKAVTANNLLDEQFLRLARLPHARRLFNTIGRQFKVRNERNSALSRCENNCCCKALNGTMTAGTAQTVPTNSICGEKTQLEDHYTMDTKALNMTIKALAIYDTSLTPAEVRTLCTSLTGDATKCAKNKDWVKEKPKGATVGGVEYTFEESAHSNGQLNITLTQVINGSTDADLPDETKVALVKLMNQGTTAANFDAIMRKAPFKYDCEATGLLELGKGLVGGMRTAFANATEEVLGEGKGFAAGHMTSSKVEDACAAYELPNFYALIDYAPTRVRRLSTAMNSTDFALEWNFTVFHKNQTEATDVLKTGSKDLQGVSAVAMLNNPALWSGLLTSLKAHIANTYPDSAVQSLGLIGDITTVAFNGTDPTPFEDVKPVPAGLAAVGGGSGSSGTRAAPAPAKKKSTSGAFKSGVFTSFVLMMIAAFSMGRQF